MTKNEATNDKETKMSKPLVSAKIGARTVTLTLGESAGWTIRTVFRRYKSRVVLVERDYWTTCADDARKALASALTHAAANVSLGEFHAPAITPTSDAVRSEAR